jgi:hypothetical protein
VAAQGAELPLPFELRAEGSFPLQYTESVSGASRQHHTTAAPYLGMIATARLQPDLNASIFANGGHSPLGSFRDNDNTFLSFGGNLVKQWGGFRAGVSIEHTQYFDDVFAEKTNRANDVNLFASYAWRPNPDLRIRPSATIAVRLDDAAQVQRYSYSGRLDIEQRLSGPWWLVVSPRIRYADYTGSDAGRRDLRVAIVGGLKYAINESLGIRMLAGYDNRASNIASRNADKFTVGASLDFDIDFARPVWSASR